MILFNFSTNSKIGKKNITVKLGSGSRAELCSCLSCMTLWYSFSAILVIIFFSWQNENEIHDCEIKLPIVKVLALLKIFQDGSYFPFLDIGASFWNLTYCITMQRSFLAVHCWRHYFHCNRRNLFCTAYLSEL